MITLTTFIQAYTIGSSWRQCPVQDGLCPEAALAIAMLTAEMGPYAH